MSLIMIHIFSEVSDLDTGLLLEVWEKGMLWDKAIGYYWCPLNTIPFTKQVRTSVFFTFTKYIRRGTFRLYLKFSRVDIQDKVSYFKITFNSSLQRILCGPFKEEYSSPTLETKSNRKKSTTNYFKHLLSFKMLVSIHSFFSFVRRKLYRKR